MSEVNERTQRTSLLRGPVEDIPGLTSYLAANFVSLASGGVVTGEVFIASGGALYLYDPVVDTDQELTVVDGDLFVGGVAVGGVTDHGALSGLSDDDHSQYYNASRLATALADYLTTAAAASGYQPLDSDLTAIAALTTTSFGRALLALADAAAARTAIGAGVGNALTTNPLSQFAATTSAQLAGVISDETGTGSLVFATSPTIVTPSITNTITITGTGTISIPILGRGVIDASANSGGADYGWGGPRIGATASYAAGAGSPGSPMDTFMSRVSAGVWRMGTTTSGAQGSLNLTNLTASGLLCAGTYTVGTLPSAGSNAYKFANVSDSSVTTNGSTVAGGGANPVMVWCNGTNWKVVAA